MITSKRVLAIVGLVLCAIFFLVSIAGIIGVWIVQARVSDIVEGVFEVADQALVGLNSGVERMAARQDEISTRLDEVSSGVEQLGARVVETPVLILGINELLDGRLVPALQQTDQVARELYGGLNRLQASLAVLNRLTFRKWQEQVNEADAFLTEAIGFFDQLNSELSALRNDLQQKKQDRVETVVGVVQKPIERMDTLVENSQTRLQNFYASLQTLQTNLQATEQSLLSLILWIAVLLWLALVWLAISQFLAGRYLWEMQRALSSAALPEPESTAEPGVGELESTEEASTNREMHSAGEESLAAGESPTETGEA
jgi:hypothetical protein